MNLVEVIVQSIREVFPDLEDLSITEDTRLEEIPGWDSMASVNLQMCLEEALRVSLPEELLAGGNTVAEIAGQLAEQTGQAA